MSYGNILMFLEPFRTVGAAKIISMIEFRKMSKLSICQFSFFFIASFLMNHPTSLPASD